MIYIYIYGNTSIVTTTTTTTNNNNDNNDNTETSTVSGISRIRLIYSSSQATYPSNAFRVLFLVVQRFFESRDV